MNMGTPGHPEGVSHWSNKAMYGHKFKSYLRMQKGFWLFFRECCGECEGTGHVENILKDVAAVRIEDEYDAGQTGRYYPDILLERRGLPQIWIEITHTSKPSQRKLAYCRERGIDVFELDGSRRPEECSVLKAHISPRNCRSPQRSRLNDLWNHLHGLDDPVVGIADHWNASSLDWHFRLQEEDLERRLKRHDQLRQVVREGKLRCTRCGKPFGMFEGGTGFHASFVWSHRPHGGCGKVPMCQGCEFEIRGGWEGLYPEDAGSWGLDGGCERCQPIIAEQRQSIALAQRTRSVEMPEDYGHRLVSEPQRRKQGYVVGRQTVSRSELQAVLMLFEYVLTCWLPPGERNALMLEEVQRINRAVLYTNSDLDRDWLEGVGESYIPEGDVPDDSGGDKFLSPKRWWRELPPFPLAVV